MHFILYTVYYILYTICDMLDTILCTILDYIIYNTIYYNVPARPRLHACPSCRSLAVSGVALPRCSREISKEFITMLYIRTYILVT